MSLARQLRFGPLRSALSLLGLGALGFACVLVVTACGSPSAASSGTTAGTTTTTPTVSTGTSTTATASAFSKYEQCITAHGGTAFGRAGFGGRGFFGGSTTGTTTTATTPATTTGTSTTSTRPRRTVSPAEQKAISACASLRPTGGAGGFGGAGASGRNSAAFSKFTQCLKSHGVTLSSGGAGFGFGRGGTPPSSADQKAIADCRSDLPSGGLGGAPGASGGSGAPSSSSFQALQTCLKQHGYTAGAPGASSKLSAAIAACRSVASHGAGTTTTPATTTSG